MRYCLCCGSWYYDDIDYCEICNVPYTEKPFEYSCNDGALIKITPEQYGEILDQMKHRENKITLLTDEII